MTITSLTPAEVTKKCRKIKAKLKCRSGEADHEVGAAFTVKQFENGVKKWSLRSLDWTGYGDELWFHGKMLEEDDVQVALEMSKVASCFVKYANQSYKISRIICGRGGVLIGAAVFVTWFLFFSQSE